MNRFLFTFFVVLFFSAPSLAASYTVGLRAESGADAVIQCGDRTACTGAAALAGHPDIQFTMEASGGFLIVTFFQSGYHLPVQTGPGGRARGTFVVKADTLKTGRKMIFPLIISAPDAGNLRSKANDPDPKTAPVAIEISMTRVSR